MNERILVVDDDPLFLDLLKEGLPKQYSVDTALSGMEALEHFRTKGPYALLLSDMNMPGMKGIELLEHVRALYPDTVRLMLTGNADRQTAIEAVNRGQVFRFLGKPAAHEALLDALEAGLKHHGLQRLEREILEGTLAGSIKLLTDVLGMVAPNALGQGQRLRDSMARFARHLGVVSRWDLELGALLSSLGYAAVPTGILRKLAAETPLLADEKDVLRCLPQISRDLLVSIPRLGEVAEIVLYQHKHFDGSGFPADAVAGEVIPLGARLLHILQDRLKLEAEGEVKAEVYQAMLDRSGYYDPYLLDQCFKCFPDALITAVNAARPVLAHKVADVLPGDVVASDIMTKDGITLVGAGSDLTAMMIARLVNFRKIGALQEPLLVQRGGPAQP
jgi:response regulator RpfG family c-di-GMP phosphodiesterase